MSDDDKAMAMKAIVLIDSSWDQRSGATPGTKEFILTQAPKKPRKDNMNYEVW